MKLVCKSRVRTRSILSDIYASVKNIFGGRIYPYEEAVEQCVNEAWEELKEKYPDVKNPRLMTTEFMPRAAEIIVYGVIDE